MMMHGPHSTHVTTHWRISRSVEVPHLSMRCGRYSIVFAD